MGYESEEYYGRKNAEYNESVSDEKAAAIFCIVVAVIALAATWYFLGDVFKEGYNAVFGTGTETKQVDK